MTSLISLPTRRHKPATRAELALLLGAAALLALALFGPVLPASAHQHAFADQRALWGIPCAVDVLSNLPFAIAGVWGLWALRRLAPGALDPTSRALAALFFAGLLCTAVGSGVYHWKPQDAGLLWDRLGMVLPFAGLLGLAASRVSERAGWAMAGAVLLAGPLAVLWWAHTGNLMPWAVVQLGGMLVVLALACLPRRDGALAVHLGAVIGLYAVAKLFEAADHAVFDATHQWVSGHSIKHVFAAGAAWPVLRTCLRSFQGRASTLSGWDARRGAQWIARLSTSAATPQPARQGACPKGWGEIGRLDAPAACMGTSPCKQPMHPLIPIASQRGPEKIVNTFWGPGGIAQQCCTERAARHAVRAEWRPRRGCCPQITRMKSQEGA